jgi:hypothetical protein
MLKKEALKIINHMYKNHLKNNNEDRYLVPMLEYAKSILDNKHPEQNDILIHKIKETKSNLEGWALEEKRQLESVGLSCVSGSSPREEMAQAFKLCY